MTVAPFCDCLVIHAEICGAVSYFSFVHTLVTKLHFSLKSEHRNSLLRMINDRFELSRGETILYLWVHIGHQAGSF